MTNPRATTNADTVAADKVEAGEDTGNEAGQPAPGADDGGEGGEPSAGDHEPDVDQPDDSAAEATDATAEGGDRNGADGETGDTAIDPDEDSVLEDDDHVFDSDDELLLDSDDIVAGHEDGDAEGDGDLGDDDLEPAPVSVDHHSVAAKAADAPRPEGERVAKVIARAGVASRRDAEVLIAEGRVSVNGRRLDTPAVVVTATDEIRIDNEPIPTRLRTRAWLFHKPRGLVTTNRDPEGRPTVFDALPSTLPRVVTVGRLDINTEGLLLLTNDGGLARVLELPATGWTRKYRARVHGEIDEAALAALREGSAVDGVLYGAIDVALERKVGDNAWLTVALSEGKNREVKIVLGSLGLQVTRLIRISFGPFQLGELPRGEVKEIPTRQLKDQLGPRLAAEAGADFDAPVSATVRRAVDPAAKGRKPPASASRSNGASERGRSEGGGFGSRRELPGAGGGRDNRRSAPRGRVIPSAAERAFRAETEEDSDWATPRREHRTASFDPLERGLTPLDGPRHERPGRGDEGGGGDRRGARPPRDRDGPAGGGGSRERSFGARDGAGDRRTTDRARPGGSERFAPRSADPQLPRARGADRDGPQGDDIGDRAPWSGADRDRPGRDGDSPHRDRAPRSRDGGRSAWTRDGSRDTRGRERERSSGSRDGGRSSGSRDGERGSGDRDGARSAWSREGERAPRPGGGDRDGPRRTGERSSWGRDGGSPGGGRPAEGRDRDRPYRGREGERPYRAREGERPSHGREGERPPRGRNGERADRTGPSDRPARGPDGYGGDRPRSGAAPRRDGERPSWGGAARSGDRPFSRGGEGRDGAAGGFGARERRPREEGAPSSFGGGRSREDRQRPRQHGSDGGERRPRAADTAAGTPRPFGRTGGAAGANRTGGGRDEARGPGRTAPRSGGEGGRTGGTGGGERRFRPASDRGDAASREFRGGAGPRREGGRPLFADEGAGRDRRSRSVPFGKDGPQKPRFAAGEGDGRTARPQRAPGGGEGRGPRTGGGTGAGRPATDRSGRGPSRSDAGKGGPKGFRPGGGPKGPRTGGGPRGRGRG